MSETGIVRRMDGLGRIVIPKELRRLLGLKAGDETEIAADGDRLTVRRHSRFAGFVTVCGRAVSYAASMTGCEVFLTAADRGGSRLRQTRERYAFPPADGGIFRAREGGEDAVAAPRGRFRARERACASRGSWSQSPCAPRRARWRDASLLRAITRKGTSGR